MEKNNNSKLTTTIISILYFILGVLFISATKELITTFNYILVCVCAVIGLIQIISYFFKKEKDDITLIIGVVFIWAALLLYVYYGYNILSILFSLYLFIMAVNLFQKAATEKRKIDIIFGLGAIITGVLLIFYSQDESVYTYLKITGVYLIIVAIYPLVIYIKNYTTKKIK